MLGEAIPTNPGTGLTTLSLYARPSGTAPSGGAPGETGTLAPTSPWQGSGAKTPELATAALRCKRDERIAAEILTEPRRTRHR